MAQRDGETSPVSHSLTELSPSFGHRLSLSEGQGRGGQQLGCCMAVGLGDSVMAGTFQALSSPRPYTGSQALCSWLGLEKEGWFQVAFLI